MTSASGEITVAYRVVPATVTAPQIQPGDIEGRVTPLSVATGDPAAFSGSQAFLVPLTEVGLEPLSTEFEVRFDLSKDEQALTPWADSGSNGVFHVTGVENLSENYLAWGDIEPVQAKAGSTQLRVGFAAGYGLDDKQRGAYASGLSELLGRLQDVLGKRQELDDLSVLMLGSGKTTGGTPHETLRGSIAITDGGSKLEDDAAYEASSRMFALWNRWSLVPAPGGNARWFQEGLSVMYPYRAACAVGRYSVDSASKALSSLYLQSQTSPYASLTLVEAEQQGFTDFLQQKGAVVCAAIDKKLVTLTNGEKNLDWLLGQLAKKKDHFEGRDYALVDIEETLEEGTGKSWDRDLNKWVETSDTIYSSDFSTTDVFVAGTSTGGGSFQGKTSARNWLLLLLAVLIVFSIPIVFSSYVRRSIKLDVSMPKILPDDEEEEEDQG